MLRRVVRDGKIEGKPSPGAVDDQYRGLESFFLKDGLFPDGTEQSQFILLTLYRLLANGRPVGVEQFARILSLEAPVIRAVLDTVPPSNIIWNNLDEIAGYRGLGLSETNHRLTIGQNTLYAWCAFDCLFLPALLDHHVEVTSVCPQTGQKIYLKFNSGSLIYAEQTDLYLSFVQPSSDKYHADLRRNFCCHVHFFASRQAGERWADNKSDTVLISLDQGLKLAEIRNKKGFGKVPKSAMMPKGMNYDK